jgi:hypothetical protein
MKKTILAVVGICFAVIGDFYGIFSRNMVYFYFGNSITVSFNNRCFAVDCEFDARTGTDCMPVSGHYLNREVFSAIIVN